MKDQAEAWLEQPACLHWATRCPRFWPNQAQGSSVSRAVRRADNTDLIQPSGKSLNLGNGFWMTSVFSEWGHSWKLALVCCSLFALSRLYCKQSCWTYKFPLPKDEREIRLWRKDGGRKFFGLRRFGFRSWMLKKDFWYLGNPVVCSPVMRWLSRCKFCVCESAQDSWALAGELMCSNCRQAMYWESCMWALSLFLSAGWEAICSTAGSRSRIFTVFLALLLWRSAEEELLPAMFEVTLSRRGSRVPVALRACTCCTGVVVQFSNAA